MPEKIMVKDSDGNEVEREFYSLDELQGTIKERENAWKSEREDLEKQINPNWKEAREKMKRLEALEKKGKTISDDGEVKDSEQKISIEDIEKNVSEKIKKEMVNEAIENSLSRYSEENRKVVKHFFDKLTAGEQVSSKNIESFLFQAEKLADVNSSNHPILGNFGRAPRIENDKKDFSDTEQGKGLASLMGFTYLNKK